MMRAIAAGLPLGGGTVAGDVTVNGSDNSPQFRVKYTPSATTEWCVSGGISTSGPVLYAWSDTSTDVDGTLALKGAGGLYFGNQSGILGAALDNGLGTGADCYAAFVPGPINTSGSLQARSETGAANVGLALAPLGTGALTRTFPDGTVAGGIVRGPYATDWQYERTIATTVAQGSRSVIGGGLENSTTAAALASTIAGGSNNITMGSYSWVPGGILAVDRGRWGCGAWAAGQFSTRGDAQSTEAIFRATSTSATPVALTADSLAAGSANVFNLPVSGLYLISALLASRQSSGSAGTAGDSAWKTVQFAVKMGATVGTTALVGAVATVNSGSDAAAAAWTWAITADTTNGGVSIAFTGEANKTIKSVARIMAIEVVG